MDKLLIALIILTLVTSTLAVILNTSTSTPYSPFNSYGNGYSSLVYEVKARITTHINEIDEAVLQRGDCTLILPLDNKLRQKDFDTLGNVLKKGCTVAILDEKGFSNEFLKHLGLEVKIVNVNVFDEISKISSREYPLVCYENSLERFCVATHKPSYVEVPSNNTIDLVLKTSRYAYADFDKNGFYSLNDRMGEYIVALKTYVHNGTLWIIADLDVFTNDLLNVDYNKEFLTRIVKGEPYLCIEYLSIAILDKIKNFFNVVALQYTEQERATLGLLFFFTLLMGLLVVRRSVEKP